MVVRAGTLVHDYFPNLYESYPQLAMFYSEYEKKWNLTWEADFAREAMPSLVLLCAIYCVGCFSIQRLMKHRKPFDLKRYVTEALSTSPLTYHRQSPGRLEFNVGAV